MSKHMHAEVEDSPGEDKSYIKLLKGGYLIDSDYRRVAFAL
jgi:hypothetical protein